MPLPRDQHAALAEIVFRARRMYRLSLKMQTDGLIPADKMADLYVDAQVCATYVETLWRDRRAGLETPAGESQTEFPTSEDDPASLDTNSSP